MPGASRRRLPIAEYSRMPTVNVYASDRDSATLNSISPELKRCVAAELSCKHFELTADAVSIRIISIDRGAMIAAVEIEMAAHAFPERVVRQDEICRNVMDCVKRAAPSLADVRVWLTLCELGHSW